MGDEYFGDKFPYFGEKIYGRKVILFVNIAVALQKRPFSSY